MDVFEITELKPYHLGQMSRQLRHEHAEIVLSLGKNVHQALRFYFSQSFFSRAWKINGKLAALGGVTGSTLSTEGYVWLAFTQEALRFSKEIVKETRNQLDLIMRDKDKLIAFILILDKPAQRFAEFLGFINSGPADDDFLIYTLTSEV